MPKRMLIDASHPEETRVVVLDGQKVEEFDFEAASKRPLKGNIYLAKVTRVEPSLQAAFVEYGGNRQGFLAFSEIHPDYYQIPVADRMALLAEQEAEARRRSEEEFESIETAIAPAEATSVAEVAQSEGMFVEDGTSASETPAFRQMEEPPADVENDTHELWDNGAESAPREDTIGFEPVFDKPGSEAETPEYSEEAAAERDEHGEARPARE